MFSSGDNLTVQSDFAYTSALQFISLIEKAPRVIQSLRAFFICPSRPLHPPFRIYTPEMSNQYFFYTILLTFLHGYPKPYISFFYTLRSPKMKTKICQRCAKRKPIRLFFKNITSPDGFRPECKPCTYERRNLTPRKVFK